MRYNNYHKHTHYSNIRTLDSIAKPIDYIKRAKELGHTTYFTTEHGFQGNIYEAYTLCSEYNLKCIYGVEAYYVDDLSVKDRNNYHIVLIAMSEKGRYEINKIMSVANTEGYYYKPRIDLNCLLSLTPSETVITTACVMGRLFTEDDWLNKFFIPLKNHFKNNFYLEVQNHDTLNQKKWNQKILTLKQEYNVPLIHGCDSHYIYKEDSKYRDLFLKAKNVRYDNEDDFILDYPTDREIAIRYLKQGVLSKDNIKEALKNTLIFDNSEGIEINKNFKIPIIKPDILKEELNITDSKISDDDVLKTILKKECKERFKTINKDKINDYKKAISDEFLTIKKCGMSRYFILDYIIVKKAVEKYHAILTKSGRGSAVSFLINNFLGLTEIDRLKSPITLYPSRFMSDERILNTRSLPDIDLNFANVEPVIKASKDILGEDGIYYMISYKPLQDSSAFRLWCKANEYNIKDYDEIAKNIEEYVNDEKWGSIIKDSKKFKGVIESISPSPCSFLLLDKPISEEVGLIKIANVTCCCIDGYNCDVYKYLKNDYLTVTVYEIIDKVYKMIGSPIDSIGDLVNKCDSKVWDIYANGLTTTINQADSDFDKQVLMKYKPKNLAELSAYVASIRPGFASLLNTFINREEYSTGIEELDNILKDSFHFMMYQESIMKYLVWLGIEEKGTYDIIKKISKKKFTKEELESLKKQLKKGWINKLHTEDKFEDNWKVVEDASRYSFNASHSLSVAIDSLYGAYLKANYPLEYFTVALSIYSNNLKKTQNLTKELEYFNIILKDIEFGKSQSNYSVNKEGKIIYKGICSIKYCNNQIADELNNIYTKYDGFKNKNFIELLDVINKETSLNNKQIYILIGLNYFKKFGKNGKLLKILDFYNGVKKGSKVIIPSLRKCKSINKDKLVYLDEYSISEYIIKKYSEKETEKTYSGIDNVNLLTEIFNNIPNEALSIQEQCKIEKEFLGNVIYKNNKIPQDYYIILENDVYNNKNNITVISNIRNLNTGKDLKVKLKGKLFYERNKYKEYNILKIEGFTYNYKKKKVDGKWVTSDELETLLENYEIIC